MTLVQMVVCWHGMMARPESNIAAVASLNVNGSQFFMSLPTRSFLITAPLVSLIMELNVASGMRRRNLNIFVMSLPQRMLIPLDDFYSDIEKLSWLGFEAIHLLRKRYVASIDATVYRLLEVVETVKCAALFLTDQKGEWSGRGPLWVKNSSRNRVFGGFIKSGTPIPANSIAVSCFKTGAEITEPAKETWWLDGQPRSWLVQAAKLPTIAENPEYPKVVVLLFSPSYVRNWTKNVIVV